MPNNKTSTGDNSGTVGKDDEDKGDGQFKISDSRDVEQMKNAIKNAGLTPVMSDYIYTGE